MVYWSDQNAMLPTILGDAKYRSSKDWFDLFKPLVFWRSERQNDDDGTVDGSHVVEGSVNQSPSAVPSSGCGYKRLRFHWMFPRRTDARVTST